MVSVTNLIFAVIVTISTLIIENYAENGLSCTSNDDCSGYEMCIRDECVSGCFEVECTDPNEECFTRNHDPTCICKKEFVRKGDGLCASPECTESDECHRHEECVPVIGEDKKICQCRRGFTLTPYDFHRCTYNNVTYDCDNDDQCQSTMSCAEGKCVPKCSLVSCGRNEECDDFRGDCRCKSGYSRDLNGNCVKYCINDQSCRADAFCGVLDSVPQCQCNPGFAIDKFGSGDCLANCVGNSECRIDEWCSDSRCIKALGLYDIQH